MSDAGTHEPGSAAGQHGAPYALQCMEIWGGNRAADTRVELTGLDAWVYARPYQGADEGGDIHYLSSCASGDISRLLVADVSGHGAGVAGAAGALRTLMRRNINHVEPRRLAAGLNSAFGPIAREGGFATAVVASYYRPKRRLSLCNAGHPRPMLFRRAVGGGACSMRTRTIAARGRATRARWRTSRWGSPTACATTRPACSSSPATSCWSTPTR